jgi:hypothetical protein
LLSLCLLACSAAANPPSGEGQVYSTWDVFEPDKCASIWLIKRHVDPGAVFRFYPRGEAIAEGIAFDTPDARFRRYHDRSTFETLLQHHNLDDPKARDLGRLMHDIEVNVWERKALGETREVEAALQRLLDDGTPERMVALCLDYFDRLSLPFLSDGP